MSKREQPALDLYTREGWLNIPSLASVQAWCIVVIGKRQVGKTYGTLQYVLQQGTPFVYMRRTDTEFQAITSDPGLNPFLPFRVGTNHVGIEKDGKISYKIGETEMDESGVPHIINRLGIGLTLAGISRIRGFNGSIYTDVVYDEFIPEKIVVQRKAEGDALLNAYVTINGNRELEGKPPLRLWLLANAFDIGNNVLQELGIVETVSSMSKKGEEYRLLDTGVLVVMPKSEGISKKRGETAFIRHMSRNKNNKFYQMAMENKFSYNNLSQVRAMSLRGMSPEFAVKENFYCYKYDRLRWYVCKSPFQTYKTYADNNIGKAQFFKDYPLFQAAYSLGQVYFSDVSTLLAFQKFLDIKA